MIFLTVGSEPCDRLVQAVDRWASGRPADQQIFAQIATGKYRPQNFEFVSFLTPNEYIRKFQQAQLIVSHAGMGTIITALELRKPIVVMPRRATFGETRNEHQLATVRHFQRSQQIVVADSEQELGAVIDKTISMGLENAIDDQTNGGLTSWPPDESLISFVREFVSQ